MSNVRRISSREIEFEKERIRDRASASARMKREVGRRTESFEHGGGLMILEKQGVNMSTQRHKSYSTKHRVREKVQGWA